MQNDPKRPRPIPAIRAEDYDRINGDEETASAYEPTYRDGSVRHECWGPESDRYADDER